MLKGVLLLRALLKERARSANEKKPRSNDMAEPIAFVLDTFAMLAYLQGESNGVRVRGIFQSDSQNIYMSLINVGEVLYITERKQGIRKAQEVLASIRQLPIDSSLR